MKLTLSTIGSRYASVAALNANFDAIIQAIENTVSRDGTSPNSMSGNLDMNNNRILNIPAPTSDNEPVTKAYLEVLDNNAYTSSVAAAASAASASISESNAAASASSASSSASSATSSASSASSSASAASTSASSASSSASNAATSATNAASSATTASSAATSASAAQIATEAARDSALAAYDNFDDRYLGAKASDPSLDNDGNSLNAGALYFNTTVPEMRLYTGSAWVAAYISGSNYVAQTSSTGAAVLPAGTTGERPSPVAGYIRYNSTTGVFEGYSTSWGTIGGGAAVSNDTSTASSLYPLFSSATSGTPTTIYTSNAKLLYKPSTGELSATAPVASNGIFINNATVASSYTIASGYNGSSVGPMTIGSGVTVTVSSGQRWLVL